ncbi:response regulator [Croceicoccus naphthovorans]|uniref:response regulator n=1 Tax=Croceicoccus naphthovorans TaxID=1348774 RepID=UPI00069EADD4|nr:response regulator [Croceicoccus naphthovorans]MBB3989827.1 DNA-binding NarL/FixJ family response regulator [Croceicoccus naphthovorans]
MSERPPAKRIVIVDDDVLISEYLQDLCEFYGAEVVGTAHDAQDAEAVILDREPDYVLMDLRLGGARDGVDVAETVQATLPMMKIVFISGSNEPKSMDRIASNNPHRVLIKPISPADLRNALA